MSLLTLTNQLEKLISNSKNFKLKRFESTRQSLKKFEFLLSDASLNFSSKLTKKIAEMCNYNSSKDDGRILMTSEEVLLSWIKSANKLNIKIPESLLKLLIITYINQSFLYQFDKPLKSIESIIKATKIPDQYALKSRKGKLLKFIAKLRECELFIFVKRYESAISCAQQVLEEVLKKLEKKNKKSMIHELGMAAVTAFYRIGICEQSKGLEKAAELAFENANLIGQKYLNKDKILLELDYEMIVHRKLNKTDSTEKPQKKKQKMSPINKETLETKNFDTVDELLDTKISCSSPVEGRSTSVEQNKPKQSGRYYSKEQLDRLQLMLKEETNRKILNTDNFFFNKISKHLAITGDLKSTAINIRNNINAQFYEMWKYKEMLKKKKKNLRGLSATQLPKYIIEDQIEDIESDFQKQIKLQEVKMKSKMKTKIYKKLLRSINMPMKMQHQSLPPQRLFFRPPEKRRLSQENLTQQTENRVKSPVHTQNIEEINHQIEDQMEELIHEINGTDNPKYRLKGAKDEDKSCQLADSAVRKRTLTKKLKKSIASAMVKQGSVKGILKKSHRKIL